MTARRRGQRGFTLTEILMAVGILGVGMSMVASVFPVAVDQSRQSRDSTMAALCARSVAAAMRAHRENVIRGLRATPTARTTTVRMPASTLPDALRCYNPASFLYDSSQAGTEIKSVRSYNPKVTNYGLWSAGSFVPVVFATPLSSTGYGPWRVTIVVYKARGQEVDRQNPAQEVPLTQWKDGNRAVAGEYILDWDGSVTPMPANAYGRGCAYKVERVSAPISGTATTEHVTPAGIPWVKPSPLQDARTCYAAERPLFNYGPTGTPGWVGLPQAVAAYHTILGD